MRRLTTKGFTIVELMIATAVFSVVLLLMATAIVQVGRMYYKGSIINRVQNTTRIVADDVVEAVQFGSTDVPFFSGNAPVTHTYGTNTFNAYCLGGIRYTFAPVQFSLGSNSGQINHVLWKDHLGAGDSCVALDLTQADPSPASNKGQELLGNNMRVVGFSINGSPGTIWSINITVAYGADDSVFAVNPDSTPNYTQCIGQNLGGQFCALSNIHTNAVKRL